MGQVYVRASRRAKAYYRGGLPTLSTIRHSSLQMLSGFRGKDAGASLRRELNPKGYKNLVKGAKIHRIAVVNRRRTLSGKRPLNFSR